jgi:hypothetical protein
VLAHVLARKERESNQMHQLLQLSFAKLDEESQRATDAERRATECLVRARAAIDARAQADADAAAARTELSMYKMQLEQAQREISRAQEMLDGLEARRHDAEQDAARSRSVARKLQEERSIEAAREEGKQQGYHEGLRQGILLGRREAENELRSRRHEEEEDEDGRRSRSRRRGVGDPAFTLVTPISPQQSTSERSDDLLPRGVPKCVNSTNPYLFVYSHLRTSFQVDAHPRLARLHRCLLSQFERRPSVVAQNKPTSPIPHPDGITTTRLTINCTTLSRHLLPHNHDHDHDQVSHLNRPAHARIHPMTIQRLRSFNPSRFPPPPQLHP